jgi:hypothetical protein
VADDDEMFSHNLQFMGVSSAFYPCAVEGIEWYFEECLAVVFRFRQRPPSKFT